MHWYCDENFCWPFKGYSRPRLTRLALLTCVFKTHFIWRVLCSNVQNFSRLTICVIAKCFQVITDGVSTLIMIIGVHLVLNLKTSKPLCLPVLLYRVSISVCLVNAIENKYDYKLVILNVNCVCCVLHRSVRRCHGRVCGESWYSEG